MRFHLHGLRGRGFLANSASYTSTCTGVAWALCGEADSDSAGAALLTDSRGTPPCQPRDHAESRQGLRGTQCQSCYSPEQKQQARSVFSGLFASRSTLLVFEPRWRGLCRVTEIVIRLWTLETSCRKAIRGRQSDPGATGDGLRFRAQSVCF